QRQHGGVEDGTEVFAELGTRRAGDLIDHDAAALQQAGDLVTQAVVRCQRLTITAQSLRRGCLLRHRAGYGTTTRPAARRRRAQDRRGWRPRRTAHETSAPVRRGFEMPSTTEPRSSRRGLPHPGHWPWPVLPPGQLRGSPWWCVCPG